MRFLLSWGSDAVAKVELKLASSLQPLCEQGRQPALYRIRGDQLAKSAGVGADRVRAGHGQFIDQTATTLTRLSRLRLQSGRMVIVAAWSLQAVVIFRSTASSSTTKCMLLWAAPSRCRCCSFQGRLCPLTR